MPNYGERQKHRPKSKSEFALGNRWTCQASVDCIVGTIDTAAMEQAVKQKLVDMGCTEFKSLGWRGQGKHKRFDMLGRKLTH